MQLEVKDATAPVVVKAPPVLVTRARLRLKRLPVLATVVTTVGLWETDIPLAEVGAVPESVTVAAVPVFAEYVWAKVPVPEDIDRLELLATVTAPLEVNPDVAVINPEIVGVAVQAVPVTVRFPPREVKFDPETVKVLSKVVAP